MEKWASLEAVLHNWGSQALTRILSFLLHGRNYGQRRFLLALSCALGPSDKDKVKLVSYLL